MIHSILLSAYYGIPKNTLLLLYSIYPLLRGTYYLSLKQALTVRWIESALITTSG
jgi:hypothetical protein